MTRSEMSRTLALLAVVSLVMAGPATAQTWRTVASSRQLAGEETLDVQVEYAAGRFELSGTGGPMLYRLESRFDEETFELRTDYRISDGGGHLRVDLDSRGDLNIGRLKDYDLGDGGLWLKLTRERPIDLSLDLGAAEARLDLGGLRLRRIDMETGASDTRVEFSEPNPEVAEHCSFKAGAASFRIERLGNSGCRALELGGGVGSLNLDFSGAWRHDATVEVEIGLGSLELRIPAELGVRIERQAFLMKLDAPGFRRDGNTWYSRNWGDAEHKLTVRVTGALGTIDVIRI